MPIKNYLIVKERMSKTSKGFWKVQSIHKLAEKLNKKYNIKNFIMLKSLQKRKENIPPFFKVKHESYTPKTKLTKFSNTLFSSNTSDKEFFFTSSKNSDYINYDKIETMKKDYKKNLYHKLYGNFPYEPFIYNEFQFISLQGKSKFIPRRFCDVVNDCLQMKHYNQYLEKIKKEEKNFNSNNSNVKKITTMNNAETETRVIKSKIKSVEIFPLIKNK